ncbi:MAG: hypothetical protein ACI39G_02685 [Pseudoramibacter sp.]
MAEQELPKELITMLLTGAGKAEIIEAFSEELYEAALCQLSALKIEATE